MTTKAAHYIEQLDDARCDGNWDAVPELVRKVRKHAPGRACLALAAETECAISKVTAAAAAARSSTTNTAKDLDVSERLPKLLAAIDEETHHAEDRFQARVCVGWLHWVVAEYSLALVRLPKSLDQEVSHPDAAESVTEWASVCALKGAYLRANSFMRDGQRSEALAAFRAGLPSLTRVWCGHGVRKQLRYWSELFLTEYCLLSSQAIHDGDLPLEDPSSLACFRSWARYWKIMSAPVTGGFGFKGAVPRRKIWNEYYLALSTILETDMYFMPEQADKSSSDLSARGHLRAELKRAEAAYQSLLLSEVSFPRAHEERGEIEAFVRQLIANWSILCGRGWREEDLGQGGRASICRGVLEALYSMATRTYHSTAILRSLFSIHLALSEFELAFKSFDSYLELVKKGKARVDKTGQPEPSLDDDSVVLATMAQAIMFLCLHGPPSAAEKARQLGAELEDWLSKLPQSKTQDEPTVSDAQKPNELTNAVGPHTMALAWQAIGLAHAHWSRVTHEASSRSEIQSKAIRCLRRSLSPEFGHSKDIRTFFALGLLLAERRDLTAAIEVVRAALMSSKGQENSYSLLSGPYWQERSLIPLWHLLALLLSARQDYSSAARACEGALDQFKNAALLFGTPPDPSTRSEHLKDAEKEKSQPNRGLVEDMDDTERESILEVKMTQLALTELVEGSDAAVNASSELLTLFSRLFGNIYAQPTLKVPTHNTEPPKTSGTLRSIRGSIFGGKADRSRPPTRQSSITTTGPVEKMTSIPSRPGTSQTAVPGAPAIQVTEENGHVADTTPRSRRSSLRSDSRTRNNLKKRERSSSRGRRPSVSSEVNQASVVDGESFFTPSVEAEHNDFFTRRPPPVARGNTLKSLSSFMSTKSKSSETSEVAAESTHSSPHLLPLVQFSKEKEKAHRSTILVKVWLTIAGFYRRAGLLDDCKGAVGEAQKLVQTLETEATSDSAAPSTAKTAAWAEKKSIEELWGDVWSELGFLSVAKGAPYDARSEFESALTHWPNHSTATVGLSNILLDIYSEKLLPPPTVQPLDKSSTVAGSSSEPRLEHARAASSLPSLPLGLGPAVSKPSAPTAAAAQEGVAAQPRHDKLPLPYKADCLPLADRLAARDRAFTLLSGLTRRGLGWDYSDAWFALARAHEESGSPDKAKEVLWWCVELEEAMAVREWRCIGGGSYVV